MTIDNDVNQVRTLMDTLGEDRFKIALNTILRQAAELKRATCQHKWTLSQIAGDGYTCHKCNSWKPEED